MGQKVKYWMTKDCHACAPSHALDHDNDDAFQGKGLGAVCFDHCTVLFGWWLIGMRNA
jgi:hypothetical protein